MKIDFEPFSTRWRSDPYAKYRELRDHAPAHFAPESKVWCISRYEDVHFVLDQPELFSSRAMFSLLMNGGYEGLPPINLKSIRMLLSFVKALGFSSIGMLSPRTLIAEDGKAHDQMRSVVSRGFTPRHIAALEPRIEEIASACIERTRTTEHFDLIRELAVPLPVTVIAEMLGVERERMDDFKRWSDNIIDGLTGAGRADPFNACLVGAFLEVIRYVRGVARARRKHPADDLISTIVAQQDGQAGLADADVIVFVLVLLVAGNETTTNLIGNAVSALFDHPAELAAVARDEALVPGWIEETLRYDPPVQLVFRNTTQELEIAGARIPKGAFVAPLIGSANRDERQFEDPDRFDVQRNAKGHLGLGFGKHFCLGASLGRLEAHCAMSALLPELPSLTRVEAPRKYVDSFLVRGQRELLLRRGVPSRGSPRDLT